MFRLAPLACALGLVVACSSESDVVEAPVTSTSDVMALGFRTADIRSSDGTVLKANVIEAATPGLHPALVFPSSWGLFDAEYVVQAKKLSNAGYTVLSYTPRGFYASGGAIDTAGPHDVADAHAVIDWLVAETSADPDRIGIAGVSYGAGIGLLAAAFDARIRAVGALSGWTDLIASLYANDTRRAQTVRMLQLVAEAVGQPSADFDAVLDDFWAAENVPELEAWGAQRSVATFLPALNRSRPAVLIANAYGDSIFPPNQLVDFFGAYGGPKRLELRRGDHAIPEGTGLAGLPNDVWDSLRAWMDAYLRGGPAPRNGIELHSESNGATEVFADWTHVSSRTKRHDLGFDRAIRVDGDTVAYGGIALVSGALDALTGVAPTTELAFVDAAHGAVWTGPTGASALRGISSVHLEFAPSHAKGTLVSYLYDVDALGIARLITHAPASWLDQRPGSLVTLDVRLPACDYDVAADHHLALVVDGKDALYVDENDDGASVTFRGHSWLDASLR